MAALVILRRFRFVFQKSGRFARPSLGASDMTRQLSVVVFTSQLQNRPPSSTLLVHHVKGNACHAPAYILRAISRLFVKHPKIHLRSLFVLYILVNRIVV